MRSYNRMMLSKISIFLYLFFLSCEILRYSTFSFHSFFGKLGLILTLILFCFSIVVYKYTMKQWIILIIGITIFLFSYLRAHSAPDLLYMILIMFSMSSISPQKTLMYSAKLIFGFMLILAFCSLTGIIPNLLFYRNGVMRQSLGTTYPLVFGGYLFFGCAAYIMSSNNDKIDLLKEILVTFSSFVITFKINGARNDSLGIIFLLMISILAYFKKEINKKVLLILTILTYTISIISVFITHIFPYYSNSYFYLNNLFNGRLEMQYRLFNMYVPKIFGQNITETGLGGSQGRVFNYFYIDNSYAKLLFIYGILAMVLFLGLFGYLIRKLIQNNLYKQTLVILVIMLSGIVEDAFINYIMNVILYVLLVDTDAWRRYLTDKIIPNKRGVK